jgi:hypothetical protein
MGRGRIKAFPGRESPETGEGGTDISRQRTFTPPCISSLFMLRASAAAWGS